MRQIRSILNKINRNGKLNILCFPTHERYESNLAQTGHNFYSFYHPQVKKWNSVFAPTPPNYKLVQTKFDQDLIQKSMDFDLILSQNKYGQLQLAHQLSQTYNIPICSIEHTLPHPSWHENQLSKMKSSRGHLNCFISEYSRDVWKWSENEAEVIHHGIDTNVFNNKELGRENVCLSVVNEWATRDVWCGYNFWKDASKDVPVKVVGDNPGLSKPAESVEELSNEYNKALIFLNTSLVSPIPTALLEAMACGCICISTNNCMIPEIIKHGENGLLCTTPDQMNEYTKNVLADQAKYKDIGVKAALTIQQQFSLPNFLERWNEMLWKTAEIEL